MKTYIINSFRQTLQWMRAHPLKSAIFFYLFGLLPAVAGACECLRIPAIALFIGTLIVWCVVQWLDTRKAVTLLLCTALFFQGANLNADEPQRPPEPSIGPIVVLVFVLGGVFYFGLRKLCQRTMPKPPSRDTNTQPFMALSPASAGNDCGGTWVFIGWLSDECLMPAGGDSEPLMLELRGTATRTPNGVEWRISQSRRGDPTQDLVDWPEYERLLLVEHGLVVGRSAGETHYAMNGIPCTEWETPIQFSTSSDGRPVAGVDRGWEMFDAVMERSPDLVNWQEMGRARVSDGMPIVMTDMTVSGQMFYRFQPK